MSQDKTPRRRHRAPPLKIQNPESPKKETSGDVDFDKIVEDLFKKGSYPKNNNSGKK